MKGQKLTMRFRTRRLLIESDINQKTSNDQKKISYAYFNIQISKIYHHIPPFFLNIKARDKDTIVEPILNVNITIFNTMSLSVKGIAKANASHPAARLTSSSDNILKRLGSIFTENTLSWI